MPKLNSTVKSVRLDNDVLAELEKRLNGKSYNAWLNEKIAEELGKPNKNTEIQRIDVDSTAYEDLKSMLEFYGCSFDELIRQIDTAMNLGSLTINENKLTVVLPEWAQKLCDACHELGYDVEKIVDSAIKSLKHGML